MRANNVNGRAGTMNVVGWRSRVLCGLVACTVGGGACNTASKALEVRKGTAVDDVIAMLGPPDVDERAAPDGRPPAGCLKGASRRLLYSRPMMGKLNAITRPFGIDPHSDTELCFDAAGKLEEKGMATH